MWEGSTSRLVPDPELIARTGDETFAEAFARIECHYFVNGGFFQDENQLLNNVDRIQHIPTLIVQGRYDIVCPAESAYELHRALPKSTLEIAPQLRPLRPRTRNHGPPREGSVSYLENLRYLIRWGTSASVPRRALRSAA